MKKIILIIMLLFTSNVWASDFYTNYIFLERRNELLNSNKELIKTKEVKLYNNYQEIKEDLGYQVETSNNLLFDKSDYQITEKYNYIYFDKSQSYVTQKNNNDMSVKYLTISQFPLTSTAITNIKILYKNQEIPYQKKDNYIYGDVIQKNTIINLNLNTYYNINDLSIKIITNTNQAYLSFVLNLSNDINSMQYNVKLPYGSNEHIINFENQESFTNLLTNIYWNANSSIEQVYYFYYANYKYHTYRIKKEYLNQYTETAIDGYYQDLEDYITEYDYYSREKITVKENINTVNDLLNIIEYSTVPINEIEISTTWNMNKNGEYLFCIKYNNYYFYQLMNINIETLNQKNLQDETDNLQNNDRPDIIQDNKQESINQELTTEYQENVIEKYTKNKDSIDEIIPNMKEENNLISMISENELINTSQPVRQESHSIYYYFILTISLLIIVIFIYKIKSYYVEQV